MELRSIPPERLALFIRALSARLRSHKDFEAVQAVLSVFLRVQGDLLTQDEDAISALRTLSTLQEQESERICRLIGFGLGALTFVRNAPV